MLSVAVAVAVAVYLTYKHFDPFPLCLRRPFKFIWVSYHMHLGVDSWWFLSPCGYDCFKSL